MTRARALLLLCLATGLAAAASSAASAPGSASPATAAREAAWRENNLGVALLEQFNFAEGVQAFQRALEKDPSLPGIFKPLESVSPSKTGRGSPGDFSGNDR